MDPNVTLAEIRVIARLAVEGKLADAHASTEDLAELILALDTWVTSGGFLPTDWQR